MLPYNLRSRRSHLCIPQALYIQALYGGTILSCSTRLIISDRDSLHRLGRSAEALGRHMVYDVAHNTAKLEHHTVDGKERSLLVHRKGATRAFALGMADVPERYKTTGQPIIIGGSMETGSYLLVGVPSGDQTFYSMAHGSGRTMSRTKARKTYRGEKLRLS